MKPRNKKVTAFGGGLAVLVVLYLLSAGPGFRGGRLGGRNIVAGPPHVDPVSRVTRPIDVSAAPLKGKPSDEEKTKLAINIIASSYKKLLDAPSYRRTLTVKNTPGDWAAFTLTRLRSSTGDLLRSETVNLDSTTMQPIEGRSRVEISNDTGNWEFLDSPGAEDVAFLITGDTPPPTNTRWTHDAFVAKSKGDLSVFTGFAYKISRANLEGTSVIRVKQVGEGKMRGVTIESTIDAVSGVLLSSSYSSPGLSMVEEFECNVNVTAADFEISENKIVSPTVDPALAGGYLAEKEKH